MENNFNDFFKENQICECEVIAIMPSYVLLEYAGIRGICHISEVSDYLVKDLNAFFTVGKKYKFYLIKSDSVNNSYTFSYKRLNPKLLKYHKEIIPSTAGYKNLHKKTLDRLYKEYKHS